MAKRIHSDEKRTARQILRDMYAQTSASDLGKTIGLPAARVRGVCGEAKPESIGGKFARRVSRMTGLPHRAIRNLDVPVGVCVAEDIEAEEEAKRQAAR